MNNSTCPICYNADELCYTECNHGHCISCLSKIHKCSMCRSPLVRNKLCTELKNKHPRWSEPEPIQVYPFIHRFVYRSQPQIIIAHEGVSTDITYLYNNIRGDDLVYARHFDIESHSRGSEFPLDGAVVGDYISLYPISIIVESPPATTAPPLTIQEMIPLVSVVVPMKKLESRDICAGGKYYTKAAGGGRRMTKNNTIR